MGQAGFTFEGFEKEREKHLKKGKNKLGGRVPTIDVNRREFCANALRKKCS